MAIKLKRDIGLFDVIFFGVGVILGAGIYVLIGPAAGIAGYSLWISFLIAAVVSLFTGFSYAELSAMYPKEAAEYVYVLKAYQSKPFAFIIGWLIIITGVVSAAAVALGFAGYFGNFFMNFGFPSMWIFDVRIIALILIAILSYINFWGLKESSSMNILFTLIEIGGLVLIISLGFLFGNFKQNFFVGPAGHFDLKAIFGAAIIIFFAYIGFEEIVNISEETKNPKKVLPKALIISVVVTTIIYMLTSITTVSLVSPEELAKSDAPLALAASRTPLGSNAHLMLTTIALFATSSTALVILIVSSRMLYGMANEKCLYKVLSKIHKKRRTPWIAIIIIMGFSMAFALLKDLQTVASITSLIALMTFAVINSSLIWLRYLKPDVKRPFKAPLNIGNFPLIAFLGLLTCAIMIFQFDSSLLAVGTAAIVLGVIVYVFYNEKFFGK